MMNVGENRVQNGVLDCPESKNEEKFLSVERLDSSRYAKEGSRVLCDAQIRRPDEISSSKFNSEAIRSHRLHQGSSLQALIVVLTAELCQIRTRTLSQYQKSSFLNCI
ncbi:hypothetical protein E3N88_07456 [Mikania micrantha]|uniref:Uncharacterized protein n=1 Tax=Mikania micrantha TaxID=192012 RepID=A0A5N6PTZ4_9ASTR|nr:hypothetical protein E3N88_07456 [Mikania micrantha]